MIALRLTSSCLPAAMAMLLLSCSGPIRLEQGRQGTRVLIRPGAAVNSSYDDYAPQIAPDGKTLYFTSNRPNLLGEEQDKVYASMTGAGGWSDAQRVLTGSGEDIHEGAVTFDAVHGRVYFVQCYRPDGHGDCDIYTAEQHGTGWRNYANAGLPLNSIEWDCHPSLSPDGAAIFFASERHGGKGGSDIWTSARTPEGGWSPPVNLGEEINTSGDEKTPYVASDGTLYFSSNTHAGYGGYDLFRTTRTATGWSDPVNLGRPINSADDDMFLTESASKDTLSIASNRPGGFGGFDVYMSYTEAAPPPPPEPEPLAVRYAIRNAFTMDPIPATVSLTTEGEADIVARAGNDGRFEHTITAGKEYTVAATQPGFINGVETFFYATIESGVKERQLLLTPYSEAGRKIYSFTVEFDFDLSNIRPEERHHLDSAIVLLAKFPNSTVVVSGHTDSLGTDIYNIKLGYSRATEVSGYVGRYLREKKVTLKNPMEIRTYGESEPIDTNSTEEGRQRNRRVEIAIVRNK